MIKTQERSGHLNNTAKVLNPSTLTQKSFVHGSSSPSLPHVAGNVEPGFFANSALIGADDVVMLATSNASVRPRSPNERVVLD